MFMLTMYAGDYSKTVSPEENSKHPLRLRRRGLVVRVVRIANSCSDLGQPGGRLDALNYTEILLVTGLFLVSDDNFSLFLKFVVI